MAKVGDASFHGISRALYKFGVYTLDSSFRDDVGAVYIVCDTNAKGQHQPLYVGETKELGLHLQNFDQWPRLRQSGAKCICVHVDKTESSRRSTTSDLIAYYTPSYNSG
jgi:hypothetical protein